MKKLTILSIFLFAGFTSFDGVAAGSLCCATVVEVRQETRQTIRQEDLPDVVTEAWNKGAYASSTVNEVTRVSIGIEVTYEIEYIDATGQEKIALFRADGTEID